MYIFAQRSFRVVFNVGFLELPREVVVGLQERSESWMCHWAVIALDLSVNQIYQKWPGNGYMLPILL